MTPTELLDQNQEYQDALSDEGIDTLEAAGFFATLAAGATVVFVAEASTQARSRVVGAANRMSELLGEAVFAVAPQYTMGARL